MRGLAVGQPERLRNMAELKRALYEGTLPAFNTLHTIKEALQPEETVKAIPAAHTPEMASGVETTEVVEPEGLKLTTRIGEKRQRMINYMMSVAVVGALIVGVMGSWDSSNRLNNVNVSEPGVVSEVTLDEEAVAGGALVPEAVSKDDGVIKTVAARLAAGDISTLAYDEGVWLTKGLRYTVTSMTATPTAGGMTVAVELTVMLDLQSGLVSVPIEASDFVMMTDTAYYFPTQCYFVPGEHCTFDTPILMSGAGILNLGVSFVLPEDTTAYQLILTNRDVEGNVGTLYSIQ